MGLGLTRSSLEDLLVRRQKTDRVTDLVNLDRVRGLLRTVYWRRRFLKGREELRRTLNAEASGIPAIVLEPTVTTPPEYVDDPFASTAMPLGLDPSEQWRSPSPLLSSPSASPRLGPVSPVSISRSPPHSPSLFYADASRSPMLRQISDSSMLSSDDAHSVSQRSSEDGVRPDGYLDAMATSVWGDMMREAHEDEEP